MTHTTVEHPPGSAVIPYRPGKFENVSAAYFDLGVPCYLTPRARTSRRDEPWVPGVGDDLTFRLVLGRRRNDHEALSGSLRHLQVLHDRPVLGRPKAVAPESMRHLLMPCEACRDL